MSKAKQILVFTALIVLFSALFFSFAPKKQDPGKEIVITMREFVLGSFLNELPELNKKLPNKIDVYTTLNAIKYEENKIVSIYELTPNTVRVDLLEKIKPLIIRQTCKDDMKKNTFLIICNRF